MVSPVLSVLFLCVTTTFQDWSCCLLLCAAPHAPQNWKLGRLLGSGAFGRVYLVYDSDVGRELAMKQVELGLLNAETKKQVAALECEIRILKNVKHERVVQYFGCCQGEGVLCIFMEFMSGGSIKDLMQSFGPLTVGVAASYTKQVHTCATCFSNLRQPLIIVLFC